VADSLLHEIVRNGRDLAAGTKARYARDINEWIAFAGEDPAAWTRARAEEFYTMLLTRMKPRSANRLMASLRYAANWWATRENKPELDFTKIQRAKSRERSTRRSLDAAQATALLMTCRKTQGPLDLRDFAMFVVGLETGMRQMSIAGMTVETTLVDPSKSPVGYPIALVPMKGTEGNRVQVPLSDTAIKALEPWLAWLYDHKAKKGPIFRSLQRRLTSGGQNIHAAGATPLTAAGIQKILAGRGDDAGIGHVHPHMFRHTFITWRIEAGMLPHEIAAITGHTIPGLGAMAGYIDLRTVGQKARMATPAWLKALVGVP